MNPLINDNGAGLIGAALMPRDNWAARSAERDRSLQLGAYRTAQKEQEVLLEQQAAAQTEEFLTAARSLSFMGRDVQKLGAHVKGEEKQLLKRLQEDYGGNYKKFWMAEGQQWMAGAAERLKQSPFYQQATQNRQNILAAQEARKKGEFIVGNRAPTGAGYQTGEQQLQDFLNGKADTYSFNGSYKPEDDLKPLREQYAPGKFPWERVAIDEDTKLNSLIDTHGEQLGLDKYYRQHQGTQVFYKTDPITKMYDFQRDQGRYQMDIGRFGMEQTRLNRDGVRLNMAVQDQSDQRLLRGQQATLNNLKIKKATNELSGAGIDGKTFDYKAFAEGATDELTIAPDAEGSKKLPLSGIDLSGVRRLRGTTLFEGLPDIFLQQMGVTKTKTGYEGGTVKEGFIDSNGVYPIDLSKSRYQTVAVDPKVFIDPRRIDAGNQRLQRGTKGFTRMTIQFATKEDAINAGVFSNWKVGSVPKGAVGAYDKATRQLTFYGNIGDVDRASNPNLINAAIKAQQGQKVANEDYGSGAPSLYFDTNFND